MVEGVNWGQVDVVVEYGPGTGAVTGAILERISPDTDFFAIELSSIFASAFEKRFPEVPVYRASVEQVVEICRERGIEQIDCVVSSLPWANFSDNEQDRLLDRMMAALGPDGQFTTFAYIHGLVLPSGRRFREKLQSRFSTVRRSDIVWRNAPPAFVYTCRR